MRALRGERVRGAALVAPLANGALGLPRGVRPERPASGSARAAPPLEGIAQGPLQVVLDSPLEPDLQLTRALARDAEDRGDLLK